MAHNVDIMEYDTTAAASRKHPLLSTYNPSMVNEAVKIKPISEIDTSCSTSVLPVKMESHDDCITIKEEVAHGLFDANQSVRMSEANCLFQVVDKTESHCNINEEVVESSSSIMNAALMISHGTNFPEMMNIEIKPEEEFHKVTPITDECYDRNQMKTADLSNPTAYIRSLGRERLFSCEHCLAKFTNNCSLSTHVRSHTGERPFSCEHCAAKFTFNSRLRVHMRSHNGERPYSCEHCPAKFAYSDDLKVHVRSHTGERPFSCEHCPAKFARSSNLRSHVLYHTGKRPFCCERCSANFATYGNLRKHLRYHTGELDLICEHCAAKFTCNSHLRVHMRSHTGERPFSCEHCPAKFTFSDHLRMHVRIHTGERPFGCGIIMLN